MDFSKDIEEARRLRAEKATEEARLRSEADTLVANIRESGKNPLIDAEAFDQVDAAYMRADEAKQDIARLDSAIHTTLARVGEVADQRKDSSERREARSIALRFMEAADVVRLRDAGIGRKSMRVDTTPVEVLTREEYMAGMGHARLNDFVDNTAGSAGGLIWSDRLSTVVGIPQRRPRLLDVISVDTTDSDTIEYARETTHDDEVNSVPYGTSLPQSDYGWTKDSTTVVRLGHYVVASDGALADAGQLSGILNRNLISGYQRYVESQVWAGDGSTDHLSGFLTTYGGQTQAVGSETYGKLTIAFHKALTKQRLTNGTPNDLIEDPNAFVINPQSWEAVMLEQDAQGNFLLGRGADELQTLWGMTPIITTLAASGTAFLGDFKQIILWIREGVSVSSTNSHSDFFLKGLQAIKAEGRAATAVMQKKAFCKVTGIPNA